LDIDKKDLIVMAILSILYLILSNYNLGARQIPVSTWESPGSGVVVFKFQASNTISSLYVLTGGTKPISFNIYCGLPDDWNYVTSCRGTEYYQWKKVDINKTSQYIALSFSGKSGKINEVIFTGNEGQVLDGGGIDVWFEGNDTHEVTNLLDEQGEVQFPPTLFSQTYFDEIFYVRTAEEYIEMRELYESTHPPLGKLLIASGILLSGFNPYGWRVMSVSFSTLIIPVIYLFGKKMFKSRAAASISASLLFLDFMHFTMGRIATPETFAVFFNLASCLFFYINYRSLLDEGKLQKSSIFLGFVLFSLGFSTKWYTIFGLMGQIFLILLYIVRSWRRSEKPPMMKMRPLLFQLMSILVFSILVSIAVYFFMFIPHILMGQNLHDIYGLQWKMYGYHSTLEATHPYSSAWWSWPLSLRPLWLTVDNLRGEWVSTAVAMGNPVIWWMGTFFTILVSDRGIRKRDETCIFLTATFLFQWLPYAFMSRCLFIYHFYINVPLLIMTSTYFLSEYWSDYSRRKLVVAYLIVATIAFAIFYPVISGYPVPNQYRMFLRWLPSWVF
jgi:dolichyl-phosphate-mannose-protein mannosyltransferase